MQRLIDLTKGPIANILRAGINAKQKRMQRLMSKYGQSAEINDIFKSCYYYYYYY
jgi:hypothetical protein